MDFRRFIEGPLMRATPPPFDFVIDLPMWAGKRETAMFGGEVIFVFLGVSFYMKMHSQGSICLMGRNTVLRSNSYPPGSIIPRRVR